MATTNTRPTRARCARLSLAALCVVATTLTWNPAVARADGTSSTPLATATSQGDIAGEWPLDATHFNAQKIWELSRGAGVTVAVVDSGVDAAHPDLTGQVVPGTSLLGDDSDGRSDSSSESHGTAIAALIAGTGASDHGHGIIGLAPAAKILPVRVSTGSQVTASVLSQGIIWAADHGASIINVSLGTPNPDPLLKKAVAYAEGKDAVVVASAGNNGQTSNEVEYPAGFPGVVAVSGTDQTGAFWPTSESGPDITVGAPAAQIASASNDGQYVQAEGTSYAAGYVSAALALIRSHHPHLTAGQAIETLINSTRDHRAVPDNQLGYGEIDPLAALSAPVPGATGNPLLAARPTGSSSSAVWRWVGAGAVLLCTLAGGGLALFRRRQKSAAAGPAAYRRNDAPQGAVASKQRPTSTKAKRSAVTQQSKPQTRQPYRKAATEARGRNK
ncbi:S8 family serine peptidase [Streptacidiphilus jiangxiensis]|uniref:Type VII secretion-associated serine protease mycosin n=1 Tax=Streptacidiphilus jiangxiensis TaxID=235985 RepID=A0A1H8AWW6_STRJI|nr:S8 family serine peptidase [Streptacidiphilus jiangxiensis]SEM75165.1 type VII secretion-associated serine protease mycosin [Streptacidiphilus jiangxiensis]